MSCKKPLVFLGEPTIDELSIEFRRVNSLLQDALSIAHTNFTELQNLIEEGSFITYGIVKTGDLVPDGIPIVKVENMMSDRTIDTVNLERVSTAVSPSPSHGFLETRWTA